ncbi:nucleotidyltransferase domain-containing protein [Stakelama saccharophila]|uniref:Nucleotidyltransferase family protein n=1 Tax=Stakelama saccharophila TaxID=3075605 RepID=A0ABZ0B8V3_9SPHN|nr:nucleotidyltransferase family protein [Stakelama sp. W311]WNO53036.1 nucleotidyltransferase family protein [Stakelama sp. W311]
MSAHLLIAALRDPACVTALDASGWNALIAAARAERLIGTLAERCAGLRLPDAAERILADARFSAREGRRTALWEAEATRRALAPLGVPVILLKGTAYAAAGLAAGRGRAIGDCDILVPKARIGEVERALLAAGWEWVKPDPYDDAYYRRWMHELPPLIHRDRDAMIDVHHTILPLTARVTPDAEALIADSEVLDGGLRVLGGSDMICHAAAHLFADGDLAGGLRNLWDIHCLIGDLGTDGLAARAERHGLREPVLRAVRLSHHLYGTDVPDGWRHLRPADWLFRRRLSSRDGWGRATNRLLEEGFYMRSHLLRMPPGMLARHLWTKWRKGHRPVA